MKMKLWCSVGMALFIIILVGLVSNNGNNLDYFANHFIVPFCLGYSLPALVLNVPPDEQGR